MELIVNARRADPSVIMKEEVVDNMRRVWAWGVLFIGEVADNFDFDSYNARSFSFTWVGRLVHEAWVESLKRYWSNGKIIPSVRNRFLVRERIKGIFGIPND